jgi:hypothetical protein
MPMAPARVGGVGGERGCFAAHFGPFDVVLAIARLTKF